MSMERDLENSPNPELGQEQAGSVEMPLEYAQEEYGRSRRFKLGETVISILSGIGMAGIFLVCYFIGNIALLVFITVAVGIATLELLTVFKKVSYSPAILLCLIISVGLVLGVYWRGTSAYFVILVLAIFFVPLWYLFVDKEKPAVPNIAISLFGIGYVGVLGSSAALMLAVPGDYGPNLFLTAMIGTVSYDIGGWFIGKSLGRIKITAISPNKTLEGLLGGMVLAVAIPVVLVPTLNLEPFGDAPGTFRDILILGIVIAVVAPLGDLIESMIKRNLNVKDVGTIIPGHGGVLDRIDALLYVLPATLIVARFLDLVEFS